MCTWTHLDCSCFISASLAAWKRESTLIACPKHVMHVSPFCGIPEQRQHRDCTSSVTHSSPPTTIKRAPNLQVSVFFCLPHLACLQQSFDGLDPLQKLCILRAGILQFPFHTVQLQQLTFNLCLGAQQLGLQFCRREG